PVFLSNLAQLLTVDDRGSSRLPTVRYLADFLLELGLIPHGGESGKRSNRRKRETEQPPEAGNGATAGSGKRSNRRKRETEQPPEAGNGATAGSGEVGNGTGKRANPPRPTTPGT